MAAQRVQVQVVTLAEVLRLDDRAAPGGDLDPKSRAADTVVRVAASQRHPGGAALQDDVGFSCDQVNSIRPRALQLSSKEQTATVQMDGRFAGHRARVVKR